MKMVLSTGRARLYLISSIFAFLSMGVLNDVVSLAQFGGCGQCVVDEELTDDCNVEPVTCWVVCDDFDLLTGCTVLGKAGLGNTFEMFLPEDPNDPTSLDTEADFEDPNSLDCIITEECDFEFSFEWWCYDGFLCIPFADPQEKCGFCAPVSHEVLKQDTTICWLCPTFAAMPDSARGSQVAAKNSTGTSWRQDKNE